MTRDSWTSSGETPLRILVHLSFGMLGMNCDGA